MNAPVLLKPLAERSQAAGNLGLARISSRRKTQRNKMKTKGIATSIESLPEIKMFSCIRRRLLDGIHEAIFMRSRRLSADA
jgi:hypothetical protein